MRNKIICLVFLLCLLAGCTTHSENIYPKPEVPAYMKTLPVQAWQDTESGRFAHSLQYEDKLAKSIPYAFTPGKDYRQESIDYFEHLCKTEGKDYIYKTVSGIDTIAQLRSFEIPEDKTNNPDWSPMAYKFHPYALEAPMFFDESLAGLMSNNNYSQSKIGKSIRRLYAFDFFKYQIQLNNNKIYEFTMQIKNNELIYLQPQNLSKITAKYGFTWKGLNRPEDRKYGIAGGDLIILNLDTNEIIAIQRTFIKASIQQNSPSGINWDGIGCFEQYKNSDVYREISFHNKNFQEKAKIINYSSPQVRVMPEFLHKIISPQ